MRKLLFALGIAMALVAVTAAGASAMRPDHANRQRVTVPDEDRFAPFAVTIHAGDSVQWLNNDTDDHAVVSDDAFNTAGHQGFDQILGANGGTLRLTFNHAGTFVYYCRFHAHLDASNQPVAPGPDGGIQDPNGNFGTPMSGVITVLP
jgi:plastocyanin